MKIIRTDAELQTPFVDDQLQKMGHELILLPDHVTEPELLKAIADADLLLMCYTPITKRVIDSAKQLKGIVKYGVGIDAIDIAAAKARNIVVVNVPEYAVLFCACPPIDRLPADCHWQNRCAWLLRGVSGYGGKRYGAWYCESECDRGAGCGKTARPDLYGGLPAREVPTMSV